MSWPVDKIPDWLEGLIDPKADEPLGKEKPPRSDPEETQKCKTHLQHQSNAFNGHCLETRDSLYHRLVSYSFQSRRPIQQAWAEFAEVGRHLRVAAGRRDAANFDTGRLFYMFLEKLPDIYSSPKDEIKGSAAPLADKLHLLCTAQTLINRDTQATNESQSALEKEASNRCLLCRKLHPTTTCIWLRPMQGIVQSLDSERDKKGRPSFDKDHAIKSSPTSDASGRNSNKASKKEARNEQTETAARSQEERAMVLYRDPKANLQWISKEEMDGSKDYANDESPTCDVDCEETHKASKAEAAFKNAAATQDKGASMLYQNSKANLQPVSREDLDKSVQRWESWRDRTSLPRSSSGDENQEHGARET